MVKNPSVISGVVQDAHGRPVEHSRIYFTDGPVPLPEIAALTGNDGAFKLSAPVPGTYQIECATDALAPVRVTIDVIAGKETQVQIKLDG